MKITPRTTAVPRYPALATLAVATALSLTSCPEGPQRTAGVPMSDASEEEAPAPVVPGEVIVDGSSDAAAEKSPAPTQATLPPEEIPPQRYAGEAPPAEGWEKRLPSPLP